MEKWETAEEEDDDGFCSHTLKGFVLHFVCILRVCWLLMCMCTWDYTSATLTMIIMNFFDEEVKGGEDGDSLWMKKKFKSTEFVQSHNNFND